jgi:hypothetical protein
LDWKRGLNALLGKDCDYFGWDPKIGEGCFGHKFFSFQALLRIRLFAQLDCWANGARTN